MKNEPSAIEALNFLKKIPHRGYEHYHDVDKLNMAIKVFEQALKKAETYDRVVVPLMEARRKATEGEWYKVGLPWNNASPYIISGHHDPHVGEAIIDVIEKDCFTETDNMTCEELEHEYECQQHANCDFITLAANLIAEEMKGSE